MLADELHHDVRRIGVVDIEHAHHVIADHLAGGTRLREDLVEDRRPLAAEQLDRDIAAELAIVRLPHRRRRADIEHHAELVAIAVERRLGVVIVDALAVCAQPDHRLRGERGLAGETLRDERTPSRLGPRCDRLQDLDGVATHGNSTSPCSMLCTSTR